MRNPVKKRETILLSTLLSVATTIVMRILLYWLECLLQSV